MAMNNSGKSRRQQKLLQYLEGNLFSTDEELAKLFAVSIQTIRLDRLELGIPEVRERMKKVAENNYKKVKSLSNQEIVGELVDVELEKEGLSLLSITEDMVFKKSNIARGHHLFAQANSLAIALIDAEQALTGNAAVSFKRSVRQGEKVVAKATIKAISGNKYKISVVSKSNNEVVFKGKFVVFAVDNKEGVN